ncbi:MAG: protein translocase subunit SecF [Bacillota bacterium]|nr:protein translocase subunit SecF [Bacillota bacterium]
MIKFYEKRYIYFAISLAIFVIGIASIFINGIKLDISFSGGAILKYTYENNIDAAAVETTVRNTLSREVNVQTTKDVATGVNKLSISLAGNQSLTPEQQEKLDTALKQEFKDNNLSLSESNMVEPFIGKRFLNRGILAIALSSVLIVLYVWFRFKKISSGPSAGVMALIALFHDCFVVFCAFVIFRLPINESFIAIILTILGFSVNDTIVIYDRIRENAPLKQKLGVAAVVNKSITQSITRSINTTLATIASMLMLCIFAYAYGIQSIVIFSLPMIIGLISGSYSTICIAGPLWVMWEKHKGIK